MMTDEELLAWGATNGYPPLAITSSWPGRWLPRGEAEWRRFCRIAPQSDIEIIKARVMTFEQGRSMWHTKESEIA